MSKKKNRKQLQREMIEQKKQVVASSVDIPTETAESNIIDTPVSSAR